MIRLWIVAAYASVRAGLHALLSEFEDFAILGEVSGSAELERVLPEMLADVVIYDEQSEDMLRVMQIAAYYGTGLVVLGNDLSDFLILAGTSLPGWAYLRKEAEGDEIAGAVRASSAGLIALDRHLAQRLAYALPAKEETPPQPQTPSETLTAREREVLQLMAQGLPNKNIAARLSISPHTVKFHVASILAKFGATSRTEAVTIGARHGLVTL